jgi:Fic family protein
LKLLPPDIDLESVAVLRQLAKANRALAELKGISNTIPNSNILINTLVLQEAKDSSAIENIITTNDELYQADIDIEVKNPAAKEVKYYAIALKHGFGLIQKHGFLSTNQIIEIQGILEQNDAGIRTQAGTVLKNERSGEIVYTPPQDKESIQKYLKNLEDYINLGNALDPLIKMAVIHYQFESVHPFYDGNGRTGRIINILYLVLNHLLNIPILYLSRYIIRTKQDYYRLFQQVRLENAWEEWVIYFLQGIEETSLQTIDMIYGIKTLMTETKGVLQEKLPRLYSRELLDSIFLHPYTKVDSLSEILHITRQTASKHLSALCELNILTKVKINRYNYYVNERLFDLLSGK